MKSAIFNNLADGFVRTIMNPKGKCTKQTARVIENRYHSPLTKE